VQSTQVDITHNILVFLGVIKESKLDKQGISLYKNESLQTHSQDATLKLYRNEFNLQNKFGFLFLLL